MVGLRGGKFWISPSKKTIFYQLSATQFRATPHFLFHSTICTSSQWSCRCTHMCADMHRGACAEVRRGAQRCAEVAEVHRSLQIPKVVTLRATLGERHGSWAVVRPRPSRVQRTGVLGQSPDDRAAACRPTGLSLHRYLYLTTVFLFGPYLDRRLIRSVSQPYLSYQ